MRAWACSCAADFFHDADDLMTEHDGQMRRRRAALDLIQLGMAYAADRNAEQDFAFCQGRLGKVGEEQGMRVAGQRTELAQKHRFHKLKNVWSEDCGVTHRWLIFRTEGRYTCSDHNDRPCNIKIAHLKRGSNRGLFPYSTGKWAGGKGRFE